MTNKSTLQTTIEGVKILLYPVLSGGFIAYAFRLELINIEGAPQ